VNAHQLAGRPPATVDPLTVAATLKLNPENHIQSHPGVATSQKTGHTSPWEGNLRANCGKRVLWTKRQKNTNTGSANRTRHYV